MDFLHGKDQPTFVTYDPTIECVVQPPIHTLVKPLQTPCGHRLCSKCLDVKLFNTPTTPCPARQPDCVRLSSTNVEPDNAISREMNQLQVYCLCRITGCMAVMKLRDLEKHTKECQYQTEECPNQSFGCNAPVTKKGFAEHLKMCDFKPLPCWQCRKEIPSHDTKDHQNECTMMSIPCPNSCGSRLTESELKDHIPACENIQNKINEERKKKEELIEDIDKQIRCKVQELGKLKDEIKISKLLVENQEQETQPTEHIPVSDNIQNKLLEEQKKKMELIEETDKQIRSKLEKLEELKSKVKEMDQTITGKQEEVDVLNRQIMELEDNFREKYELKE